MGKIWSDAAIRKLIDWRSCPRCDYQRLESGWCPNCGADLTSPEGANLAAASQAAVDALELREKVLGTLPVAHRPAPELQRMGAAATSVVEPVATYSPAPDRPSSQISVQSVLAVAGAGLVAIAAIVFTFFNPDLADPTTRNTVVAIISVLFLGAAWLLARAKLQFSAEAVGALGMVFVVLDIWAVATSLHVGLPEFGVAAIATIVVSAVMIVIGSIRRLRTWLWSGLVGITITPVLVGLSDGREWIVVLGFLGVGFAALLTHEIAKRLQARFDSPLLADTWTATVVQFLVLWAVVVQLFLLDADRLHYFLGVSGILAGLALMSALAVRNGATIAWSFLAGAFATVAVAVLPASYEFVDDVWLLAVIPAAAAGAAAVLAALSLIGAKRENPVLNRTALLTGALTVALATAVPATFVGTAQLSTASWRLVDPTWGLVALIGVGAVAVGSAILGAVRRSTPLLVLSLWFAALTLSTFATWSQLSDPWRVTAALAISVVLASIATWIRPVSASVLMRLPILGGAHLLVGLGAMMSLADDHVRIFGGIGVVLSIAALAVAMPRTARPFYVAVGFAYALMIFANTLTTQTTLEPDTVLGLTTILATLVAIAATLVKRVSAPYWYAVLAIAQIPFLISILSMGVDRYLWVGYSTATVFALAVIIVLVQRAGLNVLLRGLAAGALLPTLAVVVINVVAVLAERSASPITLPIIAGLVAVTLPTTGVIGSRLRRLGLPEDHARAAQLWLEISALVTGSIAVLLTVVRTASGFGTTFLVLVIIGLGAAATGLFLRRRYAWIVAFISFTGALWSLLALGEIDTVELYLMPPALAGAVIGAVAIARGRRGLAFYTVGLGVAVATPLGMLALRGNPEGSAVEWRTLGLLAGAVVLIVLGALLGRIVESSRFSRLGRLQVPTLFAAMGAASAGVVQATRYGWSWDRSVLVGEAVLVPALIFSLVAVVLATTAGALLAATQPRLAASRWLFVPAAAFLVIGPISAFRHGQAYSWTLLGLVVVLLALMIVTVLLARRGAVTLPPVWVTFAIAAITGIAGWSEHTVFRVEGFSLPLGLGLLAAGVIAMWPVKDAVPSFAAWPVGYAGSWRLLAPGILVTLVPSVLATATDPQTLRAIVVIGLALVAILVGNLRKLAAPFILGIAALPVEILIVFAVQIGEKIEPTTWWITLATAGIVILVLAVTSERGSTGDRGVAARMRDLT